MVSMQAVLTAMVFCGAGETVLLDFYSDSCPPCRAMGPTVQELIRLGYPVRKVNVQQNAALAAQYRVQNIPCYVMLVDGREVDRVVGGTSYSRLERMCKLGLKRQSPGGSPPAAAAGAAVEPTGPPVSIPALRTGLPFSAPGQQAAAADPPSQTAPDPAGQPSPATRWVPRGDADAKSDVRLIAASVRLRIEDPQGHSCGTGTIIDARKGEALVLTCGHIFRDSQGKGRIDVDLFDGDGTRRVSAELISYNLERDIGLLCIRTPGPVGCARVAPPGYRVSPGDPVITVGCNNGDRPSVHHSRVTSLNRYEGPANLQVAGLPVEGRSGGGLFSQRGLVIGVCNAADRADREGFYAALEVIHQQLDESKLAFVYDRSQGQQRAPHPADPRPAAALADLHPPPMPKRMPAAATSQAGLSEVSLASSPAARWASAQESPRLSREEQAALDELLGRLQDGARVVCVVQPHGRPDARNEVIVLDKVSTHFLRRLATGTGAQP